MQVEIAGIGVQRVVGPRREFRRAPRGLQVDITGHLRIAAGRAHGAGAGPPHHQDIGAGAQVRHASRSVGAVVVALYRERQGAVERRHIGRAGIGQRRRDNELRVRPRDRAGVERSEVAGAAQVIADDLQRIAAVLGLLVGAFDLTALTAVAGEQPDQRGENDQADGDGDHQLDDRVSPRACRTVESHDALSNTRWCRRRPWRRSSGGSRRWPRTSPSRRRARVLRWRPSPATRPRPGRRLPYTPREPDSGPAAG